MIACLILCSSGLAQAPPPLENEAQTFIQVHFLAAKRAESAGEFSKAVEEYRAILRQYPKLVPEIYQNLGLVYYLQHKYEEAAVTFTAGIQLKPDMIGSRLFLGSSLLYLEEPAKALPHLEYAHRHKPTTESAQYLAIAHITMEQFEAAAQYLKLALESADDKANYLYLLGDNYLKLSDRISDALANQNPDSPYDHFLTARVLESQGWFQVATREYLEAAKKDPMHAAIFFPLARLLAALNLNGAAQVSLERYYRLVPANQKADLSASPLPKKELADIGLKVDYEAELRALPPVTPDSAPPLPLVNRDVNQELRNRLAADRTGQWKTAVAQLIAQKFGDAVRTLGAMPKTGDWVRDYLIARALAWSDDYRGAEQALAQPYLAGQRPPALQALRWEVFQQLSLIYLNRLLEEYPQSARAHYLRARTLDAQGKREALEEYKAAIAADPRQLELHVGLADFYLSNSQYNEALQECRRELELNPYSSAAKMRVGRVYVQLREPAKGMPYLQEALRVNGNNAEVHVDLGRAYELLGDNEKALAEYRRALDLDPSMNRMRYVLARLYRKMGRTELADREYELFQQKEADERRQHLDRIQRSRTNASRGHEPLP